MKRSIIFFVSIAAVFFFGIAHAGDVMFPTTVEEIVDALTVKDGNTEYDGVTYQSKAGRVYKVIGDKRFRVRGLQGIVDAEIVPKAAAKINFDFNSSKISEDSYSLLDNFGEAMNAGLSNAVLMVAGHTDNVGADDYNRKLSQARAEAVADYLITRHHVSKERLSVKGFGESKPIDRNDTEEGRSRNRRVEFIRVE